MIQLYDSKGNHIAIFLNETLHNLRGENIGQYLSNYKVFFDMSGFYLGEIIQDRYLIYNDRSYCKDMTFGVYKDNGDIGSIRKQDKCNSILLPGNYKDINIDNQSIAKPEKSFYPSILQTY